MRRVYLDNHATTPTDPKVVSRMLPFFTEEFGNPASRQHGFGQEAEEAVSRAREEVAALLHANPEEILFTSGATESDNLAILGMMGLERREPLHLVTAATEHKAVLAAARHLARMGHRVTILPVDRYGLVDPEALATAVTPGCLVSVMFANNEIGTLAPIAELTRVVREREAIFHTDAAQAFGKIPIDVEALGIDMLSFSGHKIYGPKGIGGLYIRKRNPSIPLHPLIHGGGHEHGLRSGTHNVPGIVGLGAASEIARTSMAAEAEVLRALRDRLQAGLFEAIEGAILNGHPERRLPNNLNVSFPGAEAERLMREVSEIAVSSGAACTSVEPEPSHVLLALGVSVEMAECSIRFGLGRFNTMEEMEYVIDRFVTAVRKLRRLSRYR